MSVFQIYRNNDKPLYRRGNKVLIGICVYNMALFIGAKVFYVLKNRYVIHTLLLSCLFVSHSAFMQAGERLIFCSSRRQKWDAMTAYEKQRYLETTTDKGNKRYVVLHFLCLLMWVELMNASFLDSISDLPTEGTFHVLAPSEKGTSNFWRNPNVVWWADVYFHFYFC